MMQEAAAGPGKICNMQVASISVNQLQQQTAQCTKVLEQLDDISTNCWKLDYLAARAGYMKLTLGIFVANKKMDPINFEQLE